MKRTPLKRVSAKKRKELAETDEIRHAYIRAGLPCEGCDCMPATECHEITAGSYRHKAVREMNAQMYLCRDCHETLQGTNYTSQVARKLVAIIRAVNRCRGSQTVTVRGVLKEMVDLL